MFQLGQNIYSNIHLSRPDKLNESDTNKIVSALLIGNIGVGKTTLVNKICHQDYPTFPNNKNSTQILLHNNCIYPPKKDIFNIYDIFGISNKMDRVSSLILTRSIRLLKLNVILIQCRLENRFEKTI